VIVEEPLIGERKKRTIWGTKRSQKKGEAIERSEKPLEGVKDALLGGGSLGFRNSVPRRDQEENGAHGGEEDYSESQGRGFRKNRIGCPTR